MEIFEAGAIVRVPFPHTDGDRVQHRPALVVSQRGVGPERKQLWAVMITSAENRGWPDDVSLETGHEEVGLKAPSVIRPHKLATLDAGSATVLGHLDAERLQLVLKRVRALLG